MGFTELWIPNETLNRLRELVASVQNIPGGIMEIGVWEGRSFVQIAEAAHPRKAHAVDHFMGSSTDGAITGEVAQQRDIYQSFIGNTAHLDNVVVHRMDSDAFMEMWNEPVAFAHIDAHHSYESVKRQIEWILPKLSPGAVLCGDDYSQRWPGVVQAVDELLPGASVEQFMWIYQNEQEN